MTVASGMKMTESVRYSKFRRMRSQADCMMNADGFLITNITIPPEIAGFMLFKTGRTFIFCAQQRFQANIHDIQLLVFHWLYNLFHLSCDNGKKPHHMIIANVNQEHPTQFSTASLICFAIALIVTCFSP